METWNGCEFISWFRFPVLCNHMSHLIRVRSIAMEQFSVKSFALFMWWRAFEACSQICCLTVTISGHSNLPLVSDTFFNNSKHIKLKRFLLKNMLYGNHPLGPSAKFYCYSILVWSWSLFWEDSNWNLIAKVSPWSIDPTQLSYL
mgnify:CR=1 FL=1